MKRKVMLFSCLMISTQLTFASSYIVKLKPGASTNFLSRGFRAISDIRPLNVSYGEYAAIETSETMIRSLKNLPEVEYIELNHTYRISPVFSERPAIDTATATINDKDFGRQWGLKNTGFNGGSIFSPGKKGEDINAENAWSVTKGDNDIVVAVIDTGVDYNHPDLKRNIWTNTAELNGRLGIDDDNNGYIDDVHGFGFGGKNSDPMDSNGHGTHCAGVIGAVHNNKTGGAGVMDNVKIMPIRFINGNEGTTEDAIRAVDYAIKNGANLMSNSWGGDEDSQALKDAIKAAGEKGITFVVAAGNDNANNDSSRTFPANYNLDNLVAVGSFASSGTKSSFSNYGKKSVHVMAPGSNIYSTWTGGGYQSISGTSMATPFVAGIVGLILSHEPNLTPIEIKERVIATSVNNGSLSKYTVSGGRIDAYRALMNIRN